MNEIDIVRDVSARFDGMNIGYMLTGSMAMNYYAQPRMTRDIDVVVAIALAMPCASSILFPAPTTMFPARQLPDSSIAHRSMFNLIQQRKRHKSGLHRAERDRIPARGI